MVLLAERFKALAEPARLQILTCLRSGELTVSGERKDSSCTMPSPTAACSTSAT